MRALSIRQQPVALSPWRWITRIAFVIALAVVIARLTTPDSLRDPWETSPGSTATPAAPGPAAALVLDLLACLPGLLVLARRAIDRDFHLKWHWSFLLLLLLCSWMLLSIIWSADRFAAAVTSAHFVASACLVWSMSQLVRTPGRFRATAALSFGLLLVLVTQSAFYRFVDVPENISYWNEKKSDILKEHNWAPDSFAARQFEHKLISGELVGFFNSANSFAAVGVLVFAACVGIGLQKRRDGEPWSWLLQSLTATACLIWVLFNARSKTAAATPFVGLGLLGIFFVWRHRQPDPNGLIIQRAHATAFAIGTAMVAVTMLAVIGLGLHEHGLLPGHFSNSLDFRWKYWVASAAIFAGHPLAGVGWSNFEFYYLAHRLPEAAEEIKDPHNFLVRFFVELGAIGGLLCVAWLLRLAWEITSPGDKRVVTKPDDGAMTVKSIAVIVALGMAISIAANVDFTLPIVDVLALLMKPILYLLALLLGTMAAAMLSQHSWQVDDRPAPLIFYCMVTGLGLFLLHNLIDFSWFEAGALTLFMALLGSVLGMARDEDLPAWSGSMPIILAIVATICWVVAASMFVAPVVLAERDAADANELIRTASSDQSADALAHFRAAAEKLQQAADRVPYNVDYIFRQAKICLAAGELRRGESLLARAKQINPLLIDSYLLDANVRLSTANTDRNAVEADFDKILQLNPNDVLLHIQFGRALQKFGDGAAATVQYRLAGQINNALPAGEPKRLSADTLHDAEFRDR